MPEARFDSIGLNFLLHCLPGTLREKAIVFDHLPWRSTTVSVGPRNLPW